MAISTVSKPHFLNFLNKLDAFVGEGRGEEEGIDAKSHNGRFCASLVHPNRLSRQPVNCMMSSRDGIGPDHVMSVPPRSHLHCNWAFIAPGTYRIGLVAAGMEWLMRTFRLKVRGVSGSYCERIAYESAPSEPSMHRRRLRPVDATTDAQVALWAAVTDPIMQITSMLRHDRLHDHGHDHGPESAESRLVLAMIGVVLVGNSWLVQWLVAGSVAVADASALAGALVLGFRSCERPVGICGGAC
jgi:hypothetical protein